MADMPIPEDKQEKRRHHHTDFPVRSFENAHSKEARALGVLGECGGKTTVLSHGIALPPTLPWDLTQGPLKRRSLFQVPSHRCYDSGRKGSWLRHTGWLP